MNCEDCKFWDKGATEEGADDGNCRKYAPKPFMREDTDNHEQHYIYWPRTFSDEWCGEFQPRPLPPGTTVEIKK